MLNILPNNGALASNNIGVDANGFVFVIGTTGGSVLLQKNNIK
jgi:hypothetical protein